MVLASLTKSSTYLSKSILWDSVIAWALFIAVIVLVSIAMARPHDSRTVNFISGSAVFSVLFVGVAISCAMAIRPAVEASLASQVAQSLS